MEDVADNLFNPDPYLRQGGDMVRVGGLTYTIEPNQPMGRRISDIRVGGKPSPERRYRTAGWASVGPEAPGRPRTTSSPNTFAVSSGSGSTRAACAGGAVVCLGRVRWA